MPIVVGLASLVVAFWLRAILALLDVADWLAAWRFIDALTAPVIRLLQQAPLLEWTIVGRFSGADLVALVAVSLGAMLGLASLSIRRAAP